MSSIITFYSYKGGVGRSMALANIAYELSNRNKKVLIVDWDLEAPGIERYFSSFKITKSENGLIHLLDKMSKNEVYDYKNFLWEIEIGSKRNLQLLQSGRDSDPNAYSVLLQNFNWNSFFSEKSGGFHLENIRSQWLEDFDFVLIDSRTGLSDSSGICTILLPDVLIPMFTANYQSLFGIRDIVKYIQLSRQKLDVDRMALTVLPIPSRFGTRVEFKESQEWLTRISDILQDCFSDWIPKWIPPKSILERIKIPQIDYYTFGEKLAVVEQGSNDPEGMGYIFSKISDLIVSDFSDLRNFVGGEYYDKAKEENEINTRKKNVHEYDVYLSFPREFYSWAIELFIPTLKEYLIDELAYTPTMFNDFDGLTPNAEIKTNNIASKSKTFIFIFGDKDNLKASPISYLELELQTIIQTEKSEDIDLIFPVYYSEKSSSENSSVKSIESKRAVFGEKEIKDFSLFQISETKSSTRLRSYFGLEIEKLSKEVANSIRIKTQRLNSKRNVNIETSEYDQLRLLANEYEEVRKQMPSGKERTKFMQSIFDKMKATVKNSPSFLNELIRSKVAGERLAAIAILHKFPDQNYIDWISERIGFSEKPFVGYQASLALFIGSRAFAKNSSKEMSGFLNKALDNIGKSDYKDPNQTSNIKAALEELKSNKSD